MKGAGSDRLCRTPSSAGISDRIIFDELCRNEVNPASRNRYLGIVQELAAGGADSVILGCTEVCLLLDETNIDLPLFDTTWLHCHAALNAATR